MARFMLPPNDIRKIAVNVPNCTELKTEASPNILCFLLVDMMDEPCRIQVYCQSGTVGTCRVLNHEVREVFQRKCTLRQVHEIFHQPMLLPNVDPETFDDQDEEEDEEREPKNQHYCKGIDENSKDDAPRTDRESLIKDEQMVDIGLTILASEFDSLMYNFKSILHHKQRKEEQHQLELQQYAQQQQQHRQLIQMKQQQQQAMNNRQNQQESVEIQTMQHKQRMQLPQQMHTQKTQQAKGPTSGQSKKAQKLRKKQMQKQVRQIRQNQLRQTNK